MRLMRLLSAVIFFIALNSISAQSWKFESQITPAGFFLLSGNIDGDKHIYMRLEHDDKICGRASKSPNTMTLKGSYYYSSNANINLPIKGSYNNKDKRKYVRLYVPSDPNSKLNMKNCEPDLWYEIFENNNEFDLTRMEWKSRNMSNSIPVELRMDHDAGHETRADMIFTANDKKPLIIGISQKAQVRHISAIEDIDSGVVEGNYYATFSFHEKSRQDGNTEARCGSGIERYLGYIKINDRNELEELILKKIESCWQPERTESIRAIKGKPELGLQNY